MFYARSCLRLRVFTTARSVVLDYIYTGTPELPGSPSDVADVMIGASAVARAMREGAGAVVLPRLAASLARAGNPLRSLVA